MCGGGGAGKSKSEGIPTDLAEAEPKGKGQDREMSKVREEWGEGRKTEEGPLVFAGHKV